MTDLKILATGLGFPEGPVVCADGSVVLTEIRNGRCSRVTPDGTVSITYNGIGAQTLIGQHFTAVLNGSVAGGVLSAKGRAGANGRDFSVRVQCR